jgi:hypothetical protein
VHIDLVEVGDGAQEIACYMALVAEFLEAAPDVDVVAFRRQSFGSLGVSIAVYPLLYVD